MSDRLLQIYASDLTTCLDAVEALRAVVYEQPWLDSLELLDQTLKKVRDDYGPHTNVTIIPAD